jgi:WD40 repeat protein
VWGVAFSPDGTLLAPASDDQTARLWETRETYSISQPLTGHTGPVGGVAFSPDGTLLATTQHRSDDTAVGHRHRGNPTANPSPATPTR